MNNYYVTFGSDKQFPFQNGYIIIVAKDEREAREMFKKEFPNREGSDCLNFSFMYNGKEWDETVKYFYNIDEYFGKLTHEGFTERKDK